VTVWRIAGRGHVPLDGEGPRLYGSRWTSRGLPAVYASATLSLAALERFVHTDPDLEPADLVAVGVEIKASIRIEAVAVSDLVPNWREYPTPAELTSIGDRWLRDARSVALSVPSVVIPRERNFIINPVHRDFGKLAVTASEPFAFDPRLWKAR
jgi:RES domain-containing protein